MANTKPLGKKGSSLGRAGSGDGSATAVAETVGPIPPPARTSTLQTWIGALEKTQSGVLMLTNMLHAFRTQRISEEGFLVLFDAICSEWSVHGGHSAASIVEAIADKALATFLCSPATQLQHRCSRVTDDKTFVSNNIDFMQLPFKYTDEIPPSLLEQIESGVPEAVAQGEIRGRRLFAWVTATEQLEEVRAQTPDQGELASKVRDLLGLSHYSSTDHLLIEIQYPEDLKMTLSAAVPSFLEGGSGVVFRAKKSADNWGRAVDLSTYGDGLPEAVHPPIKFTSAFRVRRIGRVNRSAGFSFDKVVDNAEHPWRGMPEDFSHFIEGFDER